jgi:pre-mRNA-splicing factor RBM22/SLT11
MKSGGNIDEKIRDRFHGINDPVAKKILDKVKEVNLPQPPADLNITTLFIGGVDENIDEVDIKNIMQGYGKIKSIKVIYKSGVAFVCFHARNAAEGAMTSLFDRLFISNKRLKLLWAKSQLEAPSQNPAHKKKN